MVGFTTGQRGEIAGGILVKKKLTISFTSLNLTHTITEKSVTSENRIFAN
jgi:hypothetical protein